MATLSRQHRQHEVAGKEEGHLAQTRWDSDLASVTRPGRAPGTAAHGGAGTGRAGQPHAGADSSWTRFIPVPPPAPKQCSSGSGDRAGGPRSPCPCLQPLPTSVPKTVAGERGEAGSPGPGHAGMEGLSPPVPVLCRAREKPPQIVTITFAGDLHAGAVFTEEQ